MPTPVRTPLSRTVKHEDDTDFASGHVDVAVRVLAGEQFGAPLTKWDHGVLVGVVDREQVSPFGSDAFDHLDVTG